MTVSDLHQPSPINASEGPVVGAVARRPAMFLLLAGAVVAVGVVVGLSRGDLHENAHEASSAMSMTHMMTDKASAQAGRPTTVVTPISCQKLPNVPGKSLTLALVDFPPGAYTPRHRHPGSVAAFVIKGTLRSQLEGGIAETFVAGQSWFEPPGAIHLFAENASTTEPAQILATFVADDDCGPLTVPD